MTTAKDVEFVGGPLNGETHTILFGNQARMIRDDQVHVYEQADGVSNRFIYVKSEPHNKPDTDGIEP